MSPRLRGPVWPSRLRTELRREIDAAPFRRRLAEKKCGAGGRVDLVAMVHLDNLDVEIGIERLRRLADERGKEIDAEAHIARLDDHRPLRVVGDRRLVGCRKPGRADDVDDASLRREVGEEDRGCRRREVEDAVGLGEQRERVGADRNAVRAEPRKFAESLPSSGVSPRSTAPARVTPSVAAMTRTSVRPIRPAAPATTSLMSLMA